MSTLNVRIDSETASFVERLARETGRTKSEVVRDALEALRDQTAKLAVAPPSETMAHLIGSWDSGGMKLSERTGEGFARLLREKNHAHRSSRRGPAGRAD
jgi:Arc/MetJ-type ribon-helix-helix transcriptional regulator